MKIQSFFWHLSLQIIIVLGAITTGFGQPSGTGTVQQSIPTRSFSLPGGIELPPAEHVRLARNLLEKLQQINASTQEKADPGFFGTAIDFAKATAKRSLNHVADMGIGSIGFSPVGRIVGTSVLTEIKDRTLDWLFDSKKEDFRQQRQFAVRQVLENAMTEGVKLCTGDIACIDRLANGIITLPEVQEQLQEAGDLGLFDAAQERALIKAAKEQAIANFNGTVVKIDDLDVKMTGILNDVKSTMVAGFQTVNANQRTIIKGVANLIDIEQRQAIALNNIQTTLNKNFQQINIDIRNIIDLQQENLFISKSTLEAVGIVDQKVDVLNENISFVSLQISSLTSTIQDMQIEQRNKEIREIFNNSPLSIKISELQNVNSNISQLLLNQKNGEQKRQELIANFKTLKNKEDVIIATKMISTWGNVGKEALGIFCTNCPEDLSKGINAAITAANVVGNISSGNMAGAVMNVLGLFKKPEPSPELKMLQQVSRQLIALESKMNAQFKEVHKHLFALEQNLGNRLQIIDAKLEQLTQFVLAAHIQVMEQLSGIDSKLNYVINQNECTKDLILTLTKQGGQDLCKEPVSEFKIRVVSDQIRDFTDLNNFFRGNFCQPCIEALFDASNVSLVNNASFRYAQCNIEGAADNKARPDRIYAFAFQNFIGENASDSVFVNSLLLIPSNVNVAASFPDSVRRFLKRSVLELNQEDRHYRNHGAIIAYADYLLTLFSMVELLDDDQLQTPAQINQNPGFSRERARKMILILEGVQDLLNHAMFQQSVLAGNGLFPQLDDLIRGGSTVVPENNVAHFTPADLFRYNPYLSKNYGAYLLDQYIGLNMLNNIIQFKRLEKGKLRIIVKGLNILLFEDENKKPAYVISLTNLSDPAKHIPLMRGFLPISEGKVDEELYQRNLSFVFPAAYTELLSMREKITEKLTEMNLIVSPGLDAANTNFSRNDLEQLISATKE